MPTPTEQQILNELRNIQGWIESVNNNKKEIHQLTNTEDIDATDLIPVSVDGSTFKTSIQNIVSLVEVSAEQNNIRRVKGFTTASSNFLDMVAGINALSPYTVADNELMSYQTSILDAEDPLNTTIITINTRDIGKGTYGSGETSLTGKLWISGTRRLSSGDAEIEPSTQIINLGTHTSTTVEAVFNAAAEFTVQNKTVGLRLVNITLDTEEKQYFFTGVGGDYGTGGDLTALDTDFSLISGDLDPVGVVMESDYNANTILSANTDDTPTAITIAESQILGRLTGGNIKGLSVAEIKTLLGITGIRPRATIVATGVSGTYNIDFALSVEFRIVMTGATTITFSNYDKALGETTGIYFTGAVPVWPGTVNEVPGSETPDAAKRNYAVLNVFDAGSGTEVVDFMNKIMTT